MKKILLLFLIILPLQISSQQSKEIEDALIGYWEGAFIKNNAYQKIDIKFRKSGDKIFGLQIMEEWHPSYGEFEVPVKIDSLNLISFGTGYGKAELKLDKNNLELVGAMDGINPTVYLHFKKTANPPKNYNVEEIKFDSGTVKLNGHLHIPKIKKHKTAIVLVSGRGCYSEETQFNLYAKVLREYGITVLAYQKRGTGKSTGDCSKATIKDLADDLIEAKRFLSKHPNDYKHIGVLGTSAGGWTMVKAEESTNFDFMISIVGPSTSVKDQQFQSMKYGHEFYGLSNSALKSLSRYTELMFSAKNSKKDYEEMQELLKVSETENWKQLLDDTDIPTSAKEIKNLWVRRHNFNPKNILKSYKKPFLGIYGERDWIVPAKENIESLQDYFSGRTNLLTTIEAYDAEHGMEMRARQIKLDNTLNFLGGNHSYWHFYRISPSVKIEMIDFLKKHNFID
ncbi:alpha/beta hydrolase family protein [Winogradskyella jejuensis]|uniref:Pimeloyl-ACP methyl ester carboxylesterase n=1 Tax=Winogradskyella jejuensis TaxID=1089305 RepID=A0A1M5SSE5_9FLAO|nr:alpha/beta hydrolase [Winogradskyella jejuensis]SHH41390.1 Pimeloyl-ACP methyl ester carboxylesterase [Winogradskyella jejuensis]